MIRRFSRSSGYRQISQRPMLFEQEQKLFWADRYISRHVLHAHLDEESSAASRKPDEIQRQCFWIHDTFQRRHEIQTNDGNEQHRLLDLGCGPGLYSRVFQDYGFAVLGVDASPASIRYSRKHSVRQGKTARYVRADYTTMKLPDNSFSLATCIYGGMGTISDATQIRLLKSIYNTLRPGGIFVFDAFTLAYAENERLDTDWHYIPRGGFWSPRPHLLLERSYRFDERQVFVNAYTTVLKNGSSRRYLVWHRYYSPEELRARLETVGFARVMHHADLSGTPWYEGSPWIGMVAAKPAE